MIRLVVEFGEVGGDHKKKGVAEFSMNQVEQIYKRIVFAIDNFDKKDPIVVQTILEGSLDLFRNNKNRAFIIIGRGFTDFQEATLKA